MSSQGTTLYTIRQAAEYLGCDHRTLRKIVKAGQCAVIMRGNRAYIRETEIRRLNTPQPANQMTRA